MTVMSALVLLAVIWFLVFFIVLPIRLETQGDRGEVLRGTHAGSPAEPRMWRRARITTLVALALWAVVVAVILSGWIGIEDIDLFGRYRGGAR